jgi:pimeloyl-ACP methyl ester carboxylesterase
MTPGLRIVFRLLAIISLASELGAGCAAPADRDRMAGASTAEGCNQEPGNRFFWIERAFCDLPPNGPEQAKGIVIWNHGISATTEQWRAPVPPVFRLLQVRGWDVVIIKRHNLAEANWNVSLYSSVGRTLEQVRHERQRGYRRIVLAGQSFGGYITLDAAEQSADVFGVIAMAPGVREASASGRSLDPTLTERGLQRLKVERVALVFPKNDGFFSNIVRGPGAEKVLRARPYPYLLFDETSGLTGHGGGTGGKFAFLYGLCLSEFLAAPALPAGRFACPAPDARAVITELLLPKEGAPKLLEDPNRVPAEVKPLAGRWYALLEDSLGESLIFFALMDSGGSRPRVFYRLATSRIGGGIYDATIANGRVDITLPNRSRIVVEATPIGPTLTWTSADGVRVVKAPLVKVEDGTGVGTR